MVPPTTTTKRVVTNKGLGRQLFELLQSQPNVPATIDQLEGATGVDRLAIASALSYLSRQNVGVTRLMNATYVYNGPASELAGSATAVAVAEPVAAPAPTAAPRRRRVASIVRDIDTDKILLDIGGDLYVASKLKV